MDINDLMTNPMFQVGASILAHSDRPAGQGIGMGILGGLQQQRLTEQARRLQAEEERRSAAFDWKQQQQQAAAEQQQQWRDVAVPQLAPLFGPFAPMLAQQPQQAVDLLKAQLSAGKPTAFQQKMGMVGGDLDQYRKYFGPSGTDITVSTGNELRGLQDTMNLEFSKNLMGEILGGASGAYDARREAQTGKTLLKEIGGTGAWEPAKTAAARWLGVGMDSAQIAARQQFARAAKEKVMQNIANFPGALSEKELDFLEKTAPNLSDETMANWMFFELQDRAAARSIDRKRKLQQYMRANPGKGLMDFNEWYYESADPFAAFDFDQMQNQYLEEMGLTPLSAEDRKQMRAEGLID